jgi:hypothetical protein
MGHGVILGIEDERLKIKDDSLIADLNEQRDRRWNIKICQDI